MTKTKTIRLLVALKLVRHVPDVIKQGQAIVTAMTGNRWFPSPVPSLTAVGAGISALDAAETLVKTRVVGAVEARDARLKELKALLVLLALYVQGIADANAGEADVIIKSAGMNVKAARAAGKPLIAVKQGPSGSVIVIMKAATGHPNYEVQMMTGTQPWTGVPTAFNSKTTVTGLTPGLTYSFRFRTVGKTGASDWSDVVSLLVK